MFCANPHRYRPKPPPVDYTGRLTTIMTPHLVAQVEADAAVMMAQMDEWLKPPAIERLSLGPELHMDCRLEDGLLIVRDPLPSAKLARERLRCIVAQDREACPAERWTERLPASIVFVGDGPYTCRLKPVFRWERRR